MNRIEITKSSGDNYSAGVYKNEFDFIRKECMENNRFLSRRDRLIAEAVQFVLTYVFPINPIIARYKLKYSPRHKGYIER